MVYLSFILEFTIAEMIFAKSCMNQFLTLRKINLTSKMVCTESIISHMASEPSPLVLDLTFGSGTTAGKLLSASEQIRVIGVDCDPQCADTMWRMKCDYGDRFRSYISKWSGLPSLLQGDGEREQCDGVLIELGPSRTQLEDRSRGFDYSQDGRLDLRYDGSEEGGVDAAKLIKLADVDNLRRIFKVYGGVIKSKSVARELVERRYLMEDIRTVRHLQSILTQLHAQVCCPLLS